MYYQIIEDSELAQTNQSLLIGKSEGPSYNAVLSAVFSAESTTEPVLLQEAKDWIRVDITDDDTLITALITAARIMCEQYANLSFINRTVTATLKNGLGSINLPYGPLVGSITAITDGQGNDVTSSGLNCPNCSTLKVVYNAGYTSLPLNLKNAILNQIAFMYENRGNLQTATGLSNLSFLILSQVRNVES